MDFKVAERQLIGFRLGYNLVRHGDAGVHQDERGLGWGGGLGLKNYFDLVNRRWFVGVKNDLWFNTIDWKDNIDRPDELRGTTNVLVIQPTIEGGYAFSFTKSKGLILEVALSFGREINTFQDGADVGQGFILLLGLTLKY